MADMSDDAGPLVLRVVIPALVLGGVFIFARTITRTVIRPYFGWDDALIIITWFFILGFETAVFVSINRGYGKHIDDLTPEQYMSTLQAEVVGQVLGISAYPTGKASIAYLLLRIFPDKHLRWILWTFVAFNAIFFYLDAVFILIQCQPVAFQWDHSIPGGSCWNPRFIVTWGYITGVFGCLTDFLFALLPWYYISRLQMELKVKLGIGFTLSLGLFAGACSILKIYYTSTLKAHSDYSYNTVPLVIWSSLELGAINIAACIPTLGPLLVWMGERRSKYFKSGRSNSYPSSDGTFRQTPKRLLFRSPGNSLLYSVNEDHDRKIYQSKTYEVSVRNGDSDPEIGAKTSVFTEVT